MVRRGKIRCDELCWGYPHNSGTRTADGKIEYGQIKTHNPARSGDVNQRYVKSMERDSGRGQARWFIVPDDHIQGLRAHITEKRDSLVAKGQADSARWYGKQLKRLQPLGVGYSTLLSEAEIARRISRTELIARRIGLVLAGALFISQVGIDARRWWNGHTSGTLLVIGEATARAVATRESLRASPGAASAIVGGAVFLASEFYLVYEYGSLKYALDQPEFVIETGANIGALALALLGMELGGEAGAAIGGSIGGPPGALIGAPVGMVVGGLILGVGGYFAGQEFTRWMLRRFAPGYYFDMKRRRVEAELKRRSGQIASLMR